MSKHLIVLLAVFALVLSTTACDEPEVDEEPDVEEEQDVADDDNDEQARPYMHEELKNAMANLDAPEPGTAVLHFENGEEYLIEDLSCDLDDDNPEKGQIDGHHSFEDGGDFRATLMRVGDAEHLENQFSLWVFTPDDDDQDHVVFSRTTGNFPIQIEEGAEGRPAFVVVEDGTWYGGAPLDPINEQAEPYDQDFGESWIAATCD